MDVAFCVADSTGTCLPNADLKCDGLTVSSFSSPDTVTEYNAIHVLCSKDRLQCTADVLAIVDNQVQYLETSGCRISDLSIASVCDASSPYDCVKQTNCVWYQDCTVNKNVCFNQDVCVGSGCEFSMLDETEKGSDHKHIHVECAAHVHEEGNIQVSHWIASITILVISIVGCVIPFLLNSKASRVFEILRPYFDAITIGILVSLCFVHLLSESLMYAFETDAYILVSYKPQMFLFAIVLLVMASIEIGVHYVNVLDAANRKDNKHDHHHVHHHAVQGTESNKYETDNESSKSSSPSKHDSRCGSVKSSHEDEHEGCHHIDEGSSTLSLTISVFGLVIHSLAEGTAIGLAGESVVVWTIAASVIAHKFFVAIALAQTAVKLTKLRASIILGSFCVSTPFAAMLASYLAVQANETVMSYLNATSAAFVFSICLHILGEQSARKNSPTQVAIEALLFLSSFLLIVGLMYWHLSVHDHGHHDH